MNVSFLLPNVETVAVNAGKKETRARNGSSIIFCPKLVEGKNLTGAIQKEGPKGAHARNVPPHPHVRIDRAQKMRFVESPLRVESGRSTRCQKERLLVSNAD